MCTNLLSQYKSKAQTTLKLLLRYTTIFFLASGLIVMNGKALRESYICGNLGLLYEWVCVLYVNPLICRSYILDDLVVYDESL